MNFFDFFANEKNNKLDSSKKIALGNNIYATIKFPHIDEGGQKIQYTSWKEATSASGYGIPVPTPKMPKGMKLCSHLGVSEAVRIKLQRFLVKHWADVPNTLVTGFLEIASSGRSMPVFPREIEDKIRTSYKREPDSHVLLKEVASIYIRHELNMWLRKIDLIKYEEQQYPFIRVFSAHDERVCSTCQSYNGVIFYREDVPSIPICWECRCFYAPIVLLSEITDWPVKLRLDGTFQDISKRQFTKLWRKHAPKRLLRYM